MKFKNPIDVQISYSYILFAMYKNKHIIALKRKQYDEYKNKHIRISNISQISSTYYRLDTLWAYKYLTAFNDHYIRLHQTFDQTSQWLFNSNDLHAWPARSLGFCLMTNYEWDQINGCLNSIRWQN